MFESYSRAFELERFRRLGVRTDVWALSSEASVAKDIYAAVASVGRKTFDDLRSDVSQGNLSGWDAAWVARLARVLVLQPHAAELYDFAFDALRLAVAQLPVSTPTLQLRKTLYELMFERGEHGEARALLDADPELDDLYYGYLGADLLNPFRNDCMSSFDEWAERFNRPFTAAGLSPIVVDHGAQTPFDGLGGTADVKHKNGPLVSVIVTTFNPNPQEIRTSVRSILSQTWQNLEVLLIDDCSHEESVHVLEEIASEDERIRLIRLPVNGGTYRARNAGIAAATGVYLTGQDTDDWSHPERIAYQVSFLEESPDRIGVTIAANRTDNNLVRVALGNNPARRCEVSLMIRVETASAIGGYLPVRKAADSEFRERLEAWSESTVHRLEEPLYMIRMSPGSLSRADFRPGWSHHARRGFWSAYKHWHARATRDELEIDALNPSVPIASMAPARIAGREWPGCRKFDVCLVADWRGSTAQQRAALDELRVLAASDLTVAILHLDTPWGRTHDFRALAPEVQGLVSEGVVHRVYLDQEIELGLVIVRDPSTLDYAREMTSTLSVVEVLMVAHSDPVGRAAHLLPYDARHAHVMARKLFGRAALGRS